MDDFTIRYDDRGLSRRLSHARAVFAEEVEAAILRTSIAGVNESKAILHRHRRIDLGHLLNALAHRPIQRLGDAIRGGWGTRVRHARFVRFGRPPGAKMPPEGALLPWMARHGIPASAEFPVRRSIARRGIPGVDFLGEALIVIRPIFRQEVRAAERRAVRRLIGGG